MTGHSAAQPPNPAGQRTNSRRRKRLAQDILKSDLGPVVDLSADGMRVLSKKPMEGLVTIKLFAPGFEQSLKARVVWRRKLGFRMHELGIQFLEAAAVRPLMGWLAFWSGKPTGSLSGAKAGN
jgi:hypothetical protein